MELNDAFNTTAEERYQKAKKKVREIRSFYINLLCYCVIIPGLAVLNLILSPEHLWFVYSAIGWGVGLAFHGMTAFEFNPFFGKSWEERKFRQLMEKEKQQHDNGKL